MAEITQRPDPSARLTSVLFALVSLTGPVTCADLIWTALLLALLLAPKAGLAASDSEMTNAAAPHAPAATAARFQLFLRICDSLRSGLLYRTL